MKKKTYTATGFRCDLGGYIQKHYDGNIAAAAKDFDITRSMLWMFLNNQQVMPPKKVLAYFGYRRANSPKFVRED